MLQARGRAGVQERLRRFRCRALTGRKFTGLCGGRIKGAQRTSASSCLVRPRHLFWDMDLDFLKLLRCILIAAVTMMDMHPATGV